MLLSADALQFIDCRERSPHMSAGVALHAARCLQASPHPTCTWPALSRRWRPPRSGCASQVRAVCTHLLCVVCSVPRHTSAGSACRASARAARPCPVLQKNKPKHLPNFRSQPPSPLLRRAGQLLPLRAGAAAGGGGGASGLPGGWQDCAGLRRGGAECEGCCAALSCTVLCCAALRCTGLGWAAADVPDGGCMGRAAGAQRCARCPVRQPQGHTVSLSCTVPWL